MPNLYNKKRKSHRKKKRRKSHYKKRKKKSKRKKKRKKSQRMNNDVEPLYVPASQAHLAGGKEQKIKKMKKEMMEMMEYMAINFQLLVAIEANDSTMVTKLLNAGADANTTDAKGNTALNLAKRLKTWRLSISCRTPVLLKPVRSRGVDVIRTIIYRINIS